MERARDELSSAWWVPKQREKEQDGQESSTGG